MQDIHSSVLRLFYRGWNGRGGVFSTPVPLTKFSPDLHPLNPLAILVPLKILWWGVFKHLSHAKELSRMADTVKIEISRVQV